MPFAPPGRGPRPPATSRVVSARYRCAKCLEIGGLSPYNSAIDEEGVGPMETLVLTIHILIALALIGSVLLQRSEGGGLGIGGGGAGGGFMTARGTANLMTRVTAILAAAFFATSLLLAILAGSQRESVSIVDEVISETPAPASGPVVPTTE